MVMTPSTMRPLGAKAPDFSLPDVVSGKTVSLGTFSGRKGLLVVFLCRHCPYVKHVKDELGRLERDYAKKDLGIVAISSNDAASHPEDAPESLKAFAKEEGYGFPLLYDESQRAAKAYGAACTPDFFVYDGDRSLYYRGQLDDSRPSNGKPVTGADLRAALEALLAGRPAPSDQRPSVGCNIKWKPGNAPEYFKN